MMKVRFGDMLDHYRKNCTKEGTELLDRLSNWIVFIERIKKGQAGKETVCVTFHDPEEDSEEKQRW